MTIHDNADQMQNVYLDQIEALKRELEKERKLSKMLMELIWDKESGTRRNLLQFKS